MCNVKINQYQLCDCMKCCIYCVITRSNHICVHRIENGLRTDPIEIY